MKTKMITFASLFLMSLGIAQADNYRSFKMSDRLGRTMEIFVKIENIQESFGFNTHDVFQELKKAETPAMIDITPLIKPEREVKEDLPVYKR